VKASAQVKYKGHPLPASCPPQGASITSNSTYLRLVPASKVTADDFKSGDALGRKKPSHVDECTWKACSVFVDTTPRHKLADLTKLPNLNHMKFVAHLSVDKSAGMVKPHARDPEHISFWMYASYEPEKAVIKIEPLS